MKVLYVSKSQVWAAYQALPRELARLGVDLTVVVPPRWGNCALECARASEYDMHVLPCILSGKNHFYFYTRLIDDADFDLVHLDEEPWSTVSFQWVTTAKRWGKPLIFFTWQNIEKRYPAPFHYFERHTFEYAEAAIAGSSEAESVLRLKGFTKPVEVLPQLGVDPVPFQRRPVPELRSQLKLDGYFVVGFVGRMITAKGIADLVQAFASLPRDCALVMVGDGPGRQKAEALGALLGVADRIRWVPQVVSLRVAEYMNLFHVLALPSRSTATWKEQFGRVLIEAMACGTPPVGSSSAEIPNVIGDAGLIFPEGDVPALAQALRSLHDNPDLCQRLAEVGRDRVLRRFTHRKIAERTLQLYSRVLRRENVSAPLNVT